MLLLLLLCAVVHHLGAGAVRRVVDRLGVVADRGRGVDPGDGERCRCWFDASLVMSTTHEDDCCDQ